MDEKEESQVKKNNQIVLKLSHLGGISPNPHRIILFVQQNSEQDTKVSESFNVNGRKRSTKDKLS